MQPTTMHATLTHTATATAASCLTCRLSLDYLAPATHGIRDRETIAAGRDCPIRHHRRPRHEKHGPLVHNHSVSLELRSRLVVALVISTHVESFQLAFRLVLSREDEHRAGCFLSRKLAATFRLSNERDRPPNEQDRYPRIEQIIMVLTRCQYSYETPKTRH